jgi:hypothetical protein
MSGRFLKLLLTRIFDAFTLLKINTFVHFFSMRFISFVFLYELIIKKKAN